MLLNFPSDFFWGTSTAAAQIETASEHNWKGVKSRDGHVFDRTSDHEKRRDEDVEHIARFGTVYRCSVDWARLQTEPFGKFHHDVVEEYQQFFRKLKAKGIKIMFVLHHFSHPIWFEKKGGWLYEENIGFFSDFVKKCLNNFGGFVSYWNTFNEPNVYATNAFMLGNFPPFSKSFRKANEVLQNMGIAHETVYTMLKVYDKNIPVGISHNTCHFSAHNILGIVPTKFMDWWFNKRAATYFETCDYWGISYYAHILFDPKPISEVHRPGKLDKLRIPHDKMWAYKPEGLLPILKYFHKKYHKHIIITENGICTDNDSTRIQAIKDYLTVIQDAIKEGVHIEGYIHWSTFDNFEWDLGPTYRFGLMRTDLETKDRKDTEAARFYEKVTKTHSVDV
jgi:beta-glucosidase